VAVGEATHDRVRSEMRGALSRAQHRTAALAHSLGDIWLTQSDRGQGAVSSGKEIAIETKDDKSLAELADIERRLAQLSARLNGLSSDSDKA
jgi:hypothetical protein